MTVADQRHVVPTIPRFHISHVADVPDAVEASEAYRYSDPGDAHDPRSADSLRLAARSPGRLLLLLGPGTCFVNDGLKDLLGVVVGSACILLF